MQKQNAIDLTRLADLARTAFQAYLEWSEVSKIEVVEQELSLVSERYRYGGTPDAIGYCARKLSLLDWKSGKVYPDHVCQLAAYWNLWRENRPGDELESFHLLRFNKESGAFTHFMLPRSLIHMGWDQFVLLRQAYDLDKEIKRAFK